MAILKTAKKFKWLRGLLLTYGLDSVKLSRILGCSPPTAMKKLKEPKHFTLEELMFLVESGIPLNEMKEAVFK